MEYDVISYEGKEYFLAKKNIVNNSIYCYFVNIDDKFDVFVQKLIVENNKEYLIGLDSKDELALALSKFE